MDAVIYILTIAALLSLPVLYVLEGKFRRIRRPKMVHGILFAAGVIAVAAISITFCIKVNSAAAGIKEWAKDFFNSYLWAVGLSYGIITALLCSAAAIRHKMKRTRMIISVLLPVVAATMAIFYADLASGGYFAVDLYIRATAPALVLLSHAVPLCERKKQK